MTPFRPAVGPRLKWLLAAVFGLFAVLAVNSAYLSAVTFLEWRSGEILQNRFYLWNFLLHLVLGFAIVVPTVVFGIVHWRNVAGRPNPRAIAAGIATFVAAIVLLATGVALTRVEVLGTTVGVREPAVRDAVYWLHVLAPVAASWLFVVHRLSGRRIKWKVGVRWGAVAAGVASAAVLFHVVLPDAPAKVPVDGASYFEPSLAKTAGGGFIPARGLMSNEYCLECHADVVHSWAHSVHAASSFNNPLYAASVRETRLQAFARQDFDGRFHSRGVDDGELVLPRVPRGCRAFMGAFRARRELVQQSALHGERARDAAEGLRARAQRAGRAFLRGLPRSRAVLLRRVRGPQVGRPRVRRRQRSARTGEHHLHGVPRHRVGRQSARQRRLHD